MDYKDLIPLLISHSLARFMERNAEEAECLLVPPRRKKGNLVSKVGKLFLQQDSLKVLKKLSILYGLKEIEVAELILQSVLNLVPIVEMTDINKMTPNQVIDVLTDTLFIDKNIQKTQEVKNNLKNRK